ncbi:hypothetical protein HN014_18325 [Aquimarina sp. TRL1]|uniref:S41 family peptidase n=1 Tax=Aquimarina sp. (strain TRL1) TaxID=2736252 RepID=UPI0015897980|nr:S41 family peptidase [Aquimarina sp. TRL1]QKX06789.1 hypothetical protein HN014_18325 [Aquimarina sp. TRL1]
MKRLKSYMLLLLLGITGAKTVYTQTSFISNEKKHTVAQLKEEIQLLRKNLETIHTGLYTYTDSLRFATVFDALETSITTPLSSIELYRKLLVLNQHIKNGHTAIKPEVAYERYIKTKAPLFPLELYFDRDTLYILKNYSHNDAIKEGSILNTINGENAAAVFTTLRNQLPRDGYNTTFPEKVITDTFRRYYAYLKGIPEVYELELKTPEGVKQQLRIRGLSGEEIKKVKWERYRDNKQWWGFTGEPLMTLDIKDSIAVMKLKTFSIYYLKKAKQNFRKFFSNAFDQIAANNVQQLIIDLRDNGGGDEMPTLQLFAHLSKTPFTFYETMYTKSNRVPNPKLYNYGGFLMNFLYPTFKLKRKGDVYEIKGIPGLKEFPPATTVFNGDVYILTNGYSFSATGEITAFIKHARRATFIGEEVGGNAKQHVSGTTFTLTLPYSQIRIQIPVELFRLRVAHKNTGHGVIPDYYVKPSITDKLNGKDVEMEFAMKLIAKKKKINNNKSVFK